jgi:hypothetical protein
MRDLIVEVREGAEEAHWDALAEMEWRRRQHS